jgi:HAD superfamily hydrolase (TIGR01509 family)
VTLAAVLFDMDGTLVDSEKLWDVALRDLAEQLGGVLTPEARAQIVGTSPAETMEIFRIALNRPDLDADEGNAFLTARMAELYAAGVPWRPGAPELVDTVRAAGLRTALVTNTNRELVDVVLGSLGAHRFDVVVCGDEVAHPKPHPEPYVTAAARLGADPAACVAIEDSPTGLASARAAGCAVIAIPNDLELSPDDLVGVTLRTSLLEVDLPLLRRLVSAGRA